MSEEMESGEVESGESAEAEARTLGWVPKDQFRGPVDQWRDAEEFVRRGHEILPIVNANNRKLLDALEQANRQINGLRGTVDQQSQTMKDLLEHQASEIKRQVETKLTGLRTEKRLAIREGDHERAADLDDEIDRTKDALAEAGRSKAVAEAPPTAPQTEAWAKDFGEKNESWLGKDSEKTGLFMGICDKLHKTTSLRAGDLLEEAKKQMEAKLNPPSRSASKSESGSSGWTEGRSAGGTPSGKTFNDLPSDAKEVCKSQAKKFVGDAPGKLFKSESAWRDHYVKTFFSSQVKG